MKLTIIAILLCLAGARLSGELLRQHADPHAEGLLAGVCRSGCAEAARTNQPTLAIR